MIWFCPKFAIVIVVVKVIYFLQSHSPTGSDIDNIGLYLLVSLFFVVAAMVEFSIVVIISRRENMQIGSADSANDKDGQGRRDAVQNFNNALFESLFGSDGQFGFVKTMKKKITQGKFEETKSSSKTLDLVSSFVFPIAYAIFNAYYWCSKMKY